MGERGFFGGDLLIEAVLVAPDGGFKALQVGVPSASLLAQAFLADVDREEGCCSSARISKSTLDPPPPRKTIPSGHR